jgi:hypothetical protein
MTDPRPQELMVFEDLQEPGAWRVEWFDSNGAAYLSFGGNEDPPSICSMAD